MRNQRLSGSIFAILFILSSVACAGAGGPPNYGLDCKKITYSLVPDEVSASTINDMLQGFFMEERHRRHDIPEKYTRQNHIKWINFKAGTIRKNKLVQKYFAFAYKKMCTLFTGEYNGVVPLATSDPYNIFSTEDYLIAREVTLPALGVSLPEINRLMPVLDYKKEVILHGGQCHVFSNRIGICFASEVTENKPENFTFNWRSRHKKLSKLPKIFQSKLSFLVEDEKYNTGSYTLECDWGS